MPKNCEKRSLLIQYQLKEDTQTFGSTSEECTAFIQKLSSNICEALSQNVFNMKDVVEEQFIKTLEKTENAGGILLFLVERAVRSIMKDFVFSCLSEEISSEKENG